MAVVDLFYCFHRGLSLFLAERTKTDSGRNVKMHRIKKKTNSNTAHKLSRFRYIVFLCLIGFLLSYQLLAEERSLLGHRHTALNLPKHHFELQIHRIRFDDGIDFFNMKESELSPEEAKDNGDLEGFNFSVAYGLFDWNTIRWSRRESNLQYDGKNLYMIQEEIATRQLIFKSDNYRFLTLVFDAGIRYNGGHYLLFYDLNEINKLLKRFASSKYSIQVDEAYLWFLYTEKDYQVSVRVDRDGKPVPRFSLSDMLDRTEYFRLTCGGNNATIALSIFMETGSTSIQTKVDTTLKYYVPASLSDLIPEMPIDLAREERYAKIGGNIEFKFTKNWRGFLEYQDIKLFRDEGLDVVDYNRVIQADIDYFLHQNLALSLGAVYYERQFNGIIPFLYNRYSQNKFKHRYGVAHAGLSIIY